MFVIGYYFSWFKEVTTVITVKNNTNIEYNSELYLFDLVDIVDGTLLSNNYQIDTLELGKKDITFDYKDSNKKKKKYTFSYEIVDNTYPILSAPGNVYAALGSSIDLMKNIFCGDNYDRKLDCHVEGDYDFNSVGDYKIKYVAVDSSNNKVSKDSTLHVFKPVSSNESNNNSTQKNTSNGIELSNFIKNYKTKSSHIGMDISSYQDVYDWQAVKDAGIEFVILRIGFGPKEDMSMTFDNKFEEFYNGAKSVGLPVGIYVFSYATTVDEAHVMSKWVIDNLKDKDIDLPVAFDWENWTLFKTCGINFVDLNNIMDAFLTDLKDANYDVVNYGSKYYLEKIWDTKKYDTWLAHYNETTSYEDDFKFWQVSDKGLVPGIKGNVDIDILFE